MTSPRTNAGAYPSGCRTGSARRAAAKTDRKIDGRARSADAGSRPDRRRIMPVKRCQKVGVLKNVRTALFCTVSEVRQPLGDDTADLLAPVPAQRTGDLVGYARVSTKGQLLDRQIHARAEAGCFRIFSDRKSGKNAEREELRAVLDYLRPGDILVVPSLDRLGRSIQDLIAIVSGLRRRGIGFTSLHEALDTTTPGGRLVFHVFAALAEFIRELIVQGTNEGLDAARARGARLGRPPPAGHDRGTGTPRPRPAHSPRELRLLDRQVPRRLPRHDLQIRARAEGRTTRARRADRGSRTAPPSAVGKVAMALSVVFAAADPAPLQVGGNPLGEPSRPC